MYEEIKAYRGLELPLADFEARFARVRPEVLQGNPLHLTVCISLWGFQLKIPEQELAHDVIVAIQMAEEAVDHLSEFEHLPHATNLKKRDEIRRLVRTKMFASRASVIASFNLLEAYLNGLAWNHVRTGNLASLSAKERKLLDDSASASIRDKLRRYPEIISGSTPWSEPDPELSTLLDVLKPFRDSLVHPSPFSAPQKFGGYDKLRKLYRLDEREARMCVSLVSRMIERIHKHGDFIF